MFTALVVDDIAEARQSLIRDLADYCPEVQVTAEAEGVVSAARQIRKQVPDLVFLDIQMQDGSGFDLLEILSELPLRVIFTTASDSHAVKAFRYSAVDYLMKPIDPDELVKAVDKARKMPVDQKAGLELLKDTLKDQGRSRQKRIALHTQEKIHLVNIADIIRCESDVNYTRFFLAGNKSLVVTRTLKDFDELLSAHDFMRVHQSHLVNMAHVKEFVKKDGGHLVMSDNAQVPVASRKRVMVIEKLEN